MNQVVFTTGCRLAYFHAHHFMRFCFCRELPDEGDRLPSKEVLCMNRSQREKVLLMRGEGMSCAKIASLLCLSENTVKSFCRRNHLKANEGMTVDLGARVTSLCLYCGTRVKQTQGHRVRKYCSDKCRISWWNKNRAHPSRKNTRLLSCPVCGQQFHAYGKREREYCSHSCSNSKRADCV